MSNSVPMTRQGYEKKRAELRRMEDVEMAEIAEKIAAARDEGDLKENAEYHAQRENQAMLRAKILHLKDELSRAHIVDPSQLNKEEVAFGATVRVKDLEFDDEQEITLVGAGEDDFESGKYLVTSPVGQGLLGHKVGEKVAIEVPKGTIHYEILEIRYDGA